MNMADRQLQRMFELPLTAGENVQVTVLFGKVQFGWKVDASAMGGKSSNRIRT
jgi:hypothetical protein